MTGEYSGQSTDNDEQFTPDVPVKYSHLPPLDAWRVDPQAIRKFYAPTDDRGFVLPDATIEVVQSLFEEDYEWPIDPRVPSARPDVHHFHWMGRQYDAANFQGRTIPQRFRELPSVKGILPRQFHNVIHHVTLPPAMPKYRAMAEYVAAYSLARWAFESATEAVKLQSQFADSPLIQAEEDVLANEILISAFDRKFRGYRMHVEQLLGSEGLKSLCLEDPKFGRRKPHEVKKLLGKVIHLRSVDYVPMFRTAA